MVGAYCYTELGTAIVRSGADYAYMFEAFGPFVAFLRLWIESMIVRPCSAAVVALTFANYVIEPLYPTCDQPETAVRLLAAICISQSSVVHVCYIFMCVCVCMELRRSECFRSSNVQGIRVITVRFPDNGEGV